ncbi:MAG TPA: hypothetical protein VGJ05_07675 [Fimbriiglobus sp.]|jgi:hypothetical protein
MKFRHSLLGIVLVLGSARAQESDRRDIGSPLGPNTVQELSARLMQMQGKLDPTTLGKLLAELKTNPGLSREDLIRKIAARQSGLSEDQIASFMPMFRDPAFLEKIKGLAGTSGKGLGTGGNFSTEQIEDWTKKLNAAAPKINPPKVDLSNLGKAIPKVDLSGLAKIEPPKINPPTFNMPNGSLPNISPTAQKMMGFWETNFGPLSQSPAVKEAIQKMFASGFKADGTPTNFFGFMEQSGYNGSGFANWLNHSSGSSWHLPHWLGGENSSGSYGGGSWNWGGSGSNPSSPSGSGLLSGNGGSWWSVVLFVVVAGGGLVLWWLWPRLVQGSGHAAKVPALVRPAIDATGVVDRETLIKVFEALSLSLCGDDAKVWTHSTLGAALRAFLETNPSAADRLALIYALARYTPVDETLAPGDLQEARTHLGQLAGVPAG